MIKISITKEAITGFITEGFTMSGTFVCSTGLPENCRLWDIVYNYRDGIIILYYLEAGESVEDGTEDASLCLQEAKVLNLGFQHERSIPNYMDKYDK